MTATSDAARLSAYQYPDSQYVGLPRKSLSIQRTDPVLGPVGTASLEPQTREGQVATISQESDFDRAHDRREVEQGSRTATRSSRDLQGKSELDKPPSDC
jgi:hypothetical protein